MTTKTTNIGVSGHIPLPIPISLSETKQNRRLQWQNQLKHLNNETSSKTIILSKSVMLSPSETSNQNTSEIEKKKVFVLYIT